MADSVWGGPPSRFYLRKKPALPVIYVLNRSRRVETHNVGVFIHDSRHASSSPLIDQELAYLLWGPTGSCSSKMPFRCVTSVPGHQRGLLCTYKRLIVDMPFDCNIDRSLATFRIRDLLMDYVNRRVWNISAILRLSVRKQDTRHLHNINYKRPLQPDYLENVTVFF